MDSKPRFKIVFAKAVKGMFLLSPVNLAAMSICNRYKIQGFRHIDEGYKLKHHNNG